MSVSYVCFASISLTFLASVVCAYIKQDNSATEIVYLYTYTILGNLLILYVFSEKLDSEI
jgi:uncharacterized membrane protein